MLQKPWFKAFIWMMAIFFFFLASEVVISIFRPGPSEADSMKYMMGMMQLMENSMMGLLMNAGSDRELMGIIQLSKVLTLPIALGSIIFGLGIRMLNRRGGPDS